MTEKPSVFVVWGRLLRLPNLFTVPGDAIVGLVLAGALMPDWRWLWASLSVLLLYMGGLLLNDWFDRKEDAAERPDRPIPAGHVKGGFVALVGVAMLLDGIIVAYIGGRMPAAIVAAVLAGLVVLYDSGGRKIPVLGPLLMGGCRAASVFLGAAMIEPRFNAAVYIAAGVTLMYVVAITSIAARETEAEAPGRIVYWPAVVLVGGAILAILKVTGPEFRAIVPWAVFSAAIVEARRAAASVLKGQSPVPPFVGRLIRIMLTTQAAWVLCGLIEQPLWLSIAVCGVFAGVRVLAEWSSRKFYGS